ncbi:hypothetical protein, variant 2 [Aphanomyces astaci]|uniref:Uncharacterized protein n=1 Tax=Aphanomyces astaci TaxID=112090 RepID=W4H8L4_APHAT|nr:hypothetical protein, variant 3 [Aphanomyces astaci]XP_009822463.1 hypothetical protein, variant 2 [Aphanomyces astaci]ETV87599.1 hypothetical protein, variant 2 [Aphanomyces astaci]ETV87600.1 hypothetical protein, variant 3 [Aphanomyces astaci]|eukprot:XP_009822462.1 hypothetical protein, variant 3 [Aphanomyces astaci]
MHHMDESSSVPQDTSVYLEDDAMDLVTKGYLTQEKWLELGSGDLATAKEKIRQYINEQLNDSVRLALTKQPTDQVLHSDIIAAAAGGLWGAASAWLKSTPILNPPPQVATRNVIDPAGPSEPRSSTFLWNTAKEAALKSMETSRKIRTVDFLQLSHYCGDELSCDHIVIAINGFMTHGHTPTVNWEAIGRKKNVSGYVVLWEAGNAAEWDAFCNETSVHLETGQDDTIASHFTGPVAPAFPTHADCFSGQPVEQGAKQSASSGHRVGRAVDLHARVLPQSKGDAGRSLVGQHRDP